MTGDPFDAPAQKLLRAKCARPGCGRIIAEYWNRTGWSAAGGAQCSCVPAHHLPSGGDLQRELRRAERRGDTVTLRLT